MALRRATLVVRIRHVCTRNEPTMQDLGRDWLLAAQIRSVWVGFRLTIREVILASRANLSDAMCAACMAAEMVRSLHDVVLVNQELTWQPSAARSLSREIDCD